MSKINILKNKQKNKQPKVILPGAIILAGIGLFFLDEVAFGAPILLVAKLIGPWPAFFILSPLYFAFDFGLGTLTLNGVKKWQRSGKSNKWSIKFSEAKNSGAGRVSRWLLTTGGAAGFAACSYLGTAFLTMPLVYTLGRRRHLRQLTAISAVIYAITFVGQYAGLGALIF